MSISCMNTCLFAAYVNRLTYDGVVVKLRLCCLTEYYEVLLYALKEPAGSES